jgi:hypothetical protein
VNVAVAVAVAVAVGVGVGVNVAVAVGVKVAVAVGVGVGVPGTAVKVRSMLPDPSKVNVPANPGFVIIQPPSVPGSRQTRDDVVVNAGCRAEVDECEHLSRLKRPCPCRSCQR